MELITRLNEADSAAFQENGILPEGALKNLLFCPRNGADRLWGKPQNGQMQIVVSAKSLLKAEKRKEKGVDCLVCDTLDPDRILRVEQADTIDRTCVLMNTSMIDEVWVKPALRNLIHPDDQVCVLAFSFFDDTKSINDWNKQYKKGQGMWYRSNTDVFFPYGLKEEQIHWVNYFTDSPEQMKEAIMNSNILMLTGGAPDLMMKRIREKKLLSLLKHYQGLVIGYSAGAMIQIEEYHISPDEDYPDFSWNRGLGYLKDFDVEVHYHGTPRQNRYIEQAIQERGRKVYAIDEKGGMIVLPDGSMKFFGKVTPFEAA